MTEAFVKREQKEIFNNKFIASYTAWQNAQIQATDKRGKRYVKNFKDLFDYDKEREKLGNKDNKKLKESKDYSLLDKLAEINGEGR